MKDHVASSLDSTRQIRLKKPRCSRSMTSGSTSWPCSDLMWLCFWHSTAHGRPA